MRARVLEAINLLVCDDDARVRSAAASTITKLVKVLHYEGGTSVNQCLNLRIDLIQLKIFSMTTICKLGFKDEITLDENASIAICASTLPIS